MIMQVGKLSATCLYWASISSAASLASLYLLISMTVQLTRFSVIRLPERRYPDGSFIPRHKNGLDICWSPLPISGIQRISAGLLWRRRTGEISYRQASSPVNPSMCSRWALVRWIAREFWSKRIMPDCDFLHNAATACLTGIHFLTYIGNQSRHTDEQDRLSGNVDQRTGIGKQVQVRKALIQNRTGACQPESPSGIKIGCIDDRKIEELGV